MLSCAAAVAGPGATTTEAQEAVEPNRLEVLSAADLDTLEKALVGQALAARSKFGRKDVLDTESHSIGLRHRAGPASAEQHPDITDIMIVKSGEASMHLGGEIVNPTGAKGELRGASIRGGRVVRARPGDIFNVPPNVAHQWIVAPGEAVSFFNIKVRSTTP